MVPRRRTTGRGLPPNLTARRRAGALYYAYRSPVNGKEFGLGTDRRHAIDTALEANARLLPVNPDLVRITGNPRETVGAWIGHFVDELLPVHRSRKGKKLARKTREDYARMLRHVAADHGAIPMASFDRRQVAALLNALSPGAANKYRAALSLCFRYAVAEGRVERNPVEGTMPRPEEVTRQRLDLAGFRAIHVAAHPYLQNAMDLALQTLQARTEVARMRFADVHDGALWVRRQKTGVCLRIATGGPLLAVVARCRDAVASPYLVHRRPQRRIRAEWRDHWTQVAPETLSRGFRKAREAAGAYEHLPNEARPTFHEIRSLGADLYRKAGVDPQGLLGHTSARMTEHYLDGHEHWSDVVGGLEI